MSRSANYSEFLKLREKVDMQKRAFFSTLRALPAELEKSTALIDQSRRLLAEADEALKRR